MKAELKKRYERIMGEIKSLGIRPKMGIIGSVGKPNGTFDLRALNEAIIKNRR